MVWLGAAGGLPYAATLVGVVGVASWMTFLYAGALGVTIDDAALLRLRLVPYLVLVVLFLAGAARVAPSGGFFGHLTGADEGESDTATPSPGRGRLPA